MLPILSLMSTMNFKKQNDLKLKLLKVFSENQEKVFTKEELIAEIYQVENISTRSERLQNSYGSSLRKLIQRTRKILQKNLEVNETGEWFSYDRKQKGWTLYDKK